MYAVLYHGYCVYSVYSLNLQLKVYCLNSLREIDTLHDRIKTFFWRNTFRIMLAFLIDVETHTLFYLERLIFFH